MAIEEVINANVRFLKKYRRLKVPPANGWAIATCCDRRLSGMLEAAMGFRPGEAHVVRNAGNTITPFDNSVIRSLSMLALREGVKNIAVVGHSDCLVCSNTSDLTSAMAAAGVRPEMAGSNLREFYGFTGDTAANVRATVDKITASGLLPVGTNIYGLILRTDTGQLSTVCGHTIEQVDIPYVFDSSAYKTDSSARLQEITQQRTVRGQKKVRQFTGTIKTPKEVRSPVESVKVPVNIRTPVRKVKVPTKVKVHKGAIEVPAEIRTPQKAVSLEQVGKELESFLAGAGPAKKRDRDPGLLRGQSQGSWNPAKSRGSRKPEPKGEHKYCPRCGAEYYGHVEKCADCRVALVSQRKHRESKPRRIRPVLDDHRQSGSRRDHVDRRYGGYRRRR